MQKAEALRMMEQTKGGRRIPFHLLAVTADREAWRKKQRLMKHQQLCKKGSAEFLRLESEIEAVDVGGRALEHDACLLSGPRGMHSKKAKGKQDAAHTGAGKNPNHWVNRTRNIVLSPSTNIRKIHNSLIIEFNHQPVTY